MLTMNHAAAYRPHVMLLVGNFCPATVLPFMEVAVFEENLRPLRSGRGRMSNIIVF